LLVRLKEEISVFDQRNYQSINSMAINVVHIKTRFLLSQGSGKSVRSCKSPSSSQLCCN